MQFKFNQYLLWRNIEGVSDYTSHKMVTSHAAEILKMIIKTTLTEFYEVMKKTLSTIFHLLLDLVQSIFCRRIFEWVNFFFCLTKTMMVISQSWLNLCEVMKVRLSFFFHSLTMINISSMSFWVSKIYFLCVTVYFTAYTIFH